MMVDPSAVAALPAKKLVHAEYLLSIIGPSSVNYLIIVYHTEKYFELFLFHENIYIGLNV